MTGQLDWTWSGKLNVQGSALSEQPLLTLVRMTQVTISVSVSDGSRFWFGQGDESTMGTSVKVSKSRIEILADALKQPSDDTTVVVLTSEDNGPQDSIYLKVMRVVLSDLPLPIISLELKSQAAGTFLENIWDVLTMLRCKNEELERVVKREETVNQELQRALHLTREEKNRMEEKMLKKSNELNSSMEEENNDPVGWEDILKAQSRLHGVAHKTPVFTSTYLNNLSGSQLYFKCENLQRIGAFKFRGAYNALSALRLSKPQVTDVVTHSSGNHAQALALASSLLGLKAHIVMPSNVSSVKRNAVEGYGGNVILCEPNLPARESTAEKVIQQTNGEYIPPYNHRDIIAGQGTAAAELLEEVPDLDAIIAPIGGGGLISGTCIAAKHLSSHCMILAAEPAGADDAKQSLESGVLIPQTSPHTIADGLLTSLGDLTWTIVHHHVKQVITVSDEEIINAMKLIFERMKLVVEPSGAVSTAACLTKDFQRLGLNKVGVIISGGNLDLNKLPWLTRLG
ncbi:Probable serine racemase [Galdieria sulphuraria]|nr:Probable serine racemase [Galdieria sulphuraria]